MKQLASPANLAIVGGLFALNVALNIPLFQSGEMPYRDSIEGGYASMARFFSAHPNPWGWNPTQYCGLPAQFTYVPGLPYLAAAASRLASSFEIDHVYRIVASTFACLGPATLFLFAVYFTGGRCWALAIALAYTFFSPSYYAIHTIDVDRGTAYLPWRLQVLVKYGEGPHNAGLTLIPLALVAVWEAGVSHGFRRIFVAALLLASVALTNWVAALALAFCCLTLLLALAGSTGFRATRIFAAAGLGYGLACFWLTPSFIRTIAFNWPMDAFNYRLNWPQIFLLSGLPLALVLLRFAFARLLPDHHYLRFATLTSFVFLWIVLWFYWEGLNTVPESRRYALEMEMFLWLAIFEWLRLVMRSAVVPLRYFAVYTALAVFLSGWGQARKYCTQGFANRHPAPRQSTIEYRIAERLAALQPTGRVLVSGGLRYRLNSWFDIAQVGGSFESGLNTRMPLNLAYQIRLGENLSDIVRELETLGAEYVVVHGPKSREHYRDFKSPHKFDGILEKVWSEEDDVIYRVPFSSLAHLVKAEELSLGQPYGVLSPLDPYPAAITDPARPKLTATWTGASDLLVQGPIPEGRLASVQVNHDSGWRAEQDGRPIPIERDLLGYLVLRANTSPMAHIHLSYRGRPEQYIMAALSAMVWVASLIAALQQPQALARGPLAEDR
jgi:hypothetical protein